MADFEDGSIREAVDKSIEINRHLLPEDAGLVSAARAVADRIDNAIATESGAELTKALYLVPHVTNLLREMLATPASRLSAKVAKEVAGGKLGQLRSAKGGKS
ncbi:hypothetical protein E3T54_02895 [Cryobacterium sp. Sr8]|uniref:terminase small subunit n=1 Tax=Cryobacterium sp. Sr8 TaxID=1259203 RepID=UPI00106A0CC9|nr:hypothetical protein [Cryobacterium sp. Sr8]TFD80704.1 hypothetical protein E3T54_02895 [Cryobacterium sp. Sr8]